MTEHIDDPNLADIDPYERVGPVRRTVAWLNLAVIFAGVTVFALGGGL